MKYLILLFATIFIQVHSFAQETSDVEPKSYSKFVGGFISASGFDQEDEFSQITFGMQPYLGFAINEALSLGGFVIAGYDKRSFTSNGFNSERTTVDVSYGGGVFIRNYLTRGNLKFFLQSEVGFSVENSDFESSGINIDELLTTKNSFEFDISPQLSFDLGRVRLLARFGSATYSSTSDEIERDTKEIIRNGYTRFFASIRPQNIGLGAEFRF